MHGPQTTEIERPEGQVDVVVVDVELALEQLADLVARVRIELEPHGTPEAAPPQLELDRREKIVRLFFLQREVRVARDAEAVVVDHLHARKQLMRGARR